MLGRVPLGEEFPVSPSQSGRAETGQVAEEDLRGRAGRAEQPRTPGGQRTYRGDYVQTFVQRQGPSG
ncbi:small muscular protein [Lates japonicus]|uniref:Small muscular protein n=1 Tax=Lates japonicus TaxID=270547 RepID=A0AAD3NC59_LATJO|nr:small muscular protein [Lates japonicus]